jgi:hypothetical protein
MSVGSPQGARVGEDTAEVLFCSDLVIRRGSAVGSVALLVVLGTAACSPDSAAAPQTSTVTVTPPVSSTPAPAPSVSPSPAVPALAQQPTRAGAQAFARYFFEVYNYAFWTADPAPLKAISDSQCVYCKSNIDVVESVRAQQARVEGGRIEVTTAVAAPGDPTDRLVVNLLLHQEAGRTLSATGALLEDLPEIRAGRVDVAVRWTGDHWLMRNAHVLKDGET